MKKLIKNLSIMYALYIALLVVLSFTGCSSTKKIEKIQSDITLNSELELKKKVDETTHLNVNASGETNSTKNTQTVENQSKETETKTTKFDTTKPVVPGTGKPPVAEETTTTEKTLSQKDNKIEENLTGKLNLQVEYNKQLKQSVDSQSNVISKLKIENESSKKTSNNWWKWLLGGICLPVIVWVAMNWTKIVFPWIKKLFDFIKKII